MRPVTAAVTALLGATVLAQQSEYSSIDNVADFVTSLDIDADSGAQVSAILDPVQANNNARLNFVDTSSLACLVARVVFGPKLYTQTSADYEDLVDNNWSMTCWLASRCILQPTTAVDVSKAILISSFLGSKFSVRSGGHNPNIGFSSIGKEGMLIDLSQLNQVTLSPDGTRAAIGPGNRWGDVYKQLGSSGKMAIGGRANAIGVGGLLLGGGLSYWSSIHGLASSKVINYEVVLGDGSIVNANKNSNADLWWALKAGGSNFGIVTKFDVETVENGQIYFEGLLFDVSQYEELLRATAKYAALAEDDPDASATYNLGPTGGAVYLAYNKPLERPAIFDLFYNIAHQIMINSTLGTWVDYHDAVSSLNGFESLRIAISTYDRKWDIATLLDHYALYQNVSNDVQSRLNATLYLAPQIFSKSALKATIAQGGGPIEFSDETHCFVEIMITWKDPNYDEEAEKALLDLGNDIQATAKGFGTDLNFHYMNDAGAGQNVLKSYGSLEKMRAVSRAYDPFQVFQHLQYAGFLLRNS